MLERRRRGASFAFPATTCSPWLAPKPRETSHELVVLLAWRRGPRFIRVLLTLVEDLFDVVGWPYDGVDHVVLDDVHETMLDAAPRVITPSPPWG